MNFFNMGEGTFLDALASLEFKLSVSQGCFSASASSGLLELFSTSQKSTARRSYIHEERKAQYLFSAIHEINTFYRQVHNLSNNYSQHFNF